MILRTRYVYKILKNILKNIVFLVSWYEKELLSGWKIWGEFRPYISLGTGRQGTMAFTSSVGKSDRTGTAVRSQGILDQDRAVVYMMSCTSSFCLQVDMSSKKPRKKSNPYVPDLHFKNVVKNLHTRCVWFGCVCPSVCDISCLHDFCSRRCDSFGIPRRANRFVELWRYR